MLITIIRENMFSRIFVHSVIPENKFSRNSFFKTMISQNLGILSQCVCVNSLTFGYLLIMSFLITKKVFLLVIVCQLKKWRVISVWLLNQAQRTFFRLREPFSSMTEMNLIRTLGHKLRCWCRISDWNFITKKFYYNKK